MIEKVEVAEEALKEIITEEKRGRSDNLELAAREVPHPHYTKIHISIKNVSDEKIYISPLCFSILTKDVERIESSDKTFADKERLTGKELLPNEENKGILIFDIKELVSRLEYKDAFGNFISIDFSL
ncbi:MAG: DUF4352 domain-containing protein [bacterium]|nr:DUF4352 domain-containing protein [bacterium]